MLEKLGFEEDVIERVCFLVSKHHTYSGVERKMDYRILLEADFLVNFYEFGLEKRSIYAAKDVIMKTETGRKMCRLMFWSKNLLIKNNGTDHTICAVIFILP